MLLGVTYLSHDFSSRVTTVAPGPRGLEKDGLAVLAKSQFKPVLDIYRCLSQLHHADSTVLILSDHHVVTSLTVLNS